MIRFLSTFLIGIFVVMATALGQVATAAPYRVLVLVTEASRINETWPNDFIQKMELPAGVRETLQISVVAVPSQDGDLRAKLKNQIQTVVAQSPIDALVLAVPAKTVLTREGQVITQFENLGSLSEVGVDAQFEEVFSGLRGKMTANAQITMAGCVDFCGTSEQIQKRSQSLLSYFSVPNGTANIFDLAEEKETRIGSEAQVPGTEPGPAKVSLAYRKWIRAATFITVLGAFLQYNNSVWGVVIGGALANWVSLKVPFLFDSVLTKLSWSGAKLIMTKLGGSRVVSFVVKTSSSIYDWIAEKAKSVFGPKMMGRCEAVFA